MLTGCQSLPVSDSETAEAATEVEKSKPPAINPRLFTMGEAASAESVFELTEQQAEHFLSAFDNELPHLPPHQRLAKYLERLTNTYNYRERTLTATEAFSGTPGNCMSLVVLTTALAELVELDIDYQRLTTNPIFDKQQGVILVSDHVRTRVYAPEEDDRRFVLRRAHAIIDYFPARESRRAERLDLDSLLAMYYSNRSAESILDNELTAATQFAKLAVSHSSNHANAYNLLGILHNRIDDETRAEAFSNTGSSIIQKTLIYSIIITCC